MVHLGLNYKDKVSQLISWGHWFSFFNICLALMIASRYLLAATWPETIIGQVYLFISWLGHFSFLIFIFYLLLLFPISFLITRQKNLRFLGALFATAGLSILALDSQIFTQFNAHLNPHYFSMVSSENTNEHAQSWHLFYILLPLLFIVELFISNFIWKKRKRLNKYRIGSGASVFFLSCFLFTHLIYIWADAAQYEPIVKQKINYPLSYPMTAKSFLIEQGIIENKQEQQVLFSQQHGQFTYPLRQLDFSKSEQKHNLLLIVVDSLRHDMLSQKHMPNLWEFSQKSQLFNKHFSSSNHLSSGLFSLFYGLPASYQKDVLEHEVNSVLLEALALKQYDFQKNTMGSLSQIAMKGDALHTQGANGDLAMLENWTSWLNKRLSISKNSPQNNQENRPWFSYLLFNSVANYDSPKNNKENKLTLPQKNPEKLKQQYLNSVSFVDEQLASIFKQLQLKKLLDNTVIVITASHGQELNDNNDGLWGSGSNFSSFQTKVPMIIHWPNETAKTITQVSSHVDLVPTLMQKLLANTNDSKAYSSGYNLFSFSQRPWVIMSKQNQFALLEDEQILEFNQNGDYQLFDTHYQKLNSAKKHTQSLLQAVHELQRFYKPNQ